MIDKNRSEHIILGVDPGTLFMGYAVLKTVGQQVDILEFGAYDVHKLEGQYPRLQKEFFFLQELIDKHQGMNRKELDKLINIETNKVCEVGEWRGQNNIGKILMLCRDCIAEGTEPTIDYELLRSANIHLLGQKLTF